MTAVMKMLLIGCITAAVVVAEDSPKCSCGLFKIPTPEKTTATPVIMKSPHFPIDCKTDGKEICAKMCIALAEAVKENGPEILCETVGTITEPFLPLIYSKSCGETEWVNTGLTSDVRVCCADKAVIACQG